MNDITSKISKGELISPDVVQAFLGEATKVFLCEKETEIKTVESAFRCLWEDTKDKAIFGKRYSKGVAFKRALSVAKSFFGNKYFFDFKKPANDTENFFELQEDFLVKCKFLERPERSTGKHKMHRVKRWIKALGTNDLELCGKLESVIKKIKKLETFCFKKEWYIEDFDRNWRRLKRDLGLDTAHRVERAFASLALDYKKSSSF